MSDPKSKSPTDDDPAASGKDDPGPGTASAAESGAASAAESGAAQPTPLATLPPDGIAQDEAALGNEALMLVAETSEGLQELSRRTTTGAGELRREVGAVLRMPEGHVADPSDIDIERTDDETMIINMGPQHPSTHGVLRLMLELDGETVLRTKPVMGYLHTGMEKQAEELMYIQGGTNVTRM
ncbi:MAG TPA: hypothetical protein VHY77_05600, partial [Acidimicrobiales bacterium]|nr:hypothetical protein [Acidimicrobiales bacterium]